MFLKLSNKIRNHKGFTLIEMVVTVAILSIAVVIVSFPLATATSTEAKKAATTVSNMLSQCKIYNLSGKICALKIYYNTTSKKYVAELRPFSYRVNSDGTISANVVIGSEIYDSQVLGDKDMQIETYQLASDGSVRNQYNLMTGCSTLSGYADKKLEIVASFNNVTGVFTFCYARKQNATSNSGSSNNVFYKNSTSKIEFTCDGKTKTVNIYKNTGNIS